MKFLKNPSYLILCLLLVLLIDSCKKSKTTPAPIPPPVNLVAYWPLDDNANDKSRYGNNGIAFDVTPTANRYGKANSAYHFNGTSSYIAVPDSVKLRLGNTDFTLNAWVNLDNYNGEYLSAIISKRFSGENSGWLWGINGNLNTPLGVVYYGPGGGNANAMGNTVLTTGRWYMVTCVYSIANAQLSVYINGVLDNQVSGILPANASASANLYIGTDNPDNGNPYFFQGSLDEIRIYNTALNLSSIQQLYTSTN